MAKRRIKQNVWDNWYGYEGTRRVIAFMNSPEFTAEQHAQQWLAGSALPKPPTPLCLLCEKPDAECRCEATGEWR